MSEQSIAIDGAVNLRDLGGYRTQAGRPVRRGMLLRSGTLAYLTETGKQEFARLGVGLICDLRRDVERAEEPTPFPHGRPARLEIPIDPGSAVEMRERLGRTDLGLHDRIEFMANITAELISDHAEDYAQMFAGLLDLSDGGFLVHCSAGKDRTGIACALILHALGVPEETVIADYLLTNETIDYEGFVLPRLVEKYELAELPPKELVMALAGVREEYLRAAYGAVKERFEDVEHYIEDAIGLDAAARSELQRRYLHA